MMRRNYRTAKAPAKHPRAARRLKRAPPSQRSSRDRRALSQQCLCVGCPWTLSSMSCRIACPDLASSRPAGATSDCQVMRAVTKYRRSMKIKGAHVCLIQLMPAGRLKD